jgi:hypothetical protein
MSERYEQSGDARDLEQAVALSDEAQRSLPAGSDFLELAGDILAHLAVKRQMARKAERGRRRLPRSGRTPRRKRRKRRPPGG